MKILKSRRIRNDSPAAACHQIKILCDFTEHTSAQLLLLDPKSRQKKFDFIATMLMQSLSHLHGYFVLDVTLPETAFNE